MTSKTLPVVKLQKLQCRATGCHAWLHVSVVPVSLSVCEWDHPLHILCDPVVTMAVWDSMFVSAHGLMCFLGVFTAISDPQCYSYFMSHLANLGEVRAGWQSPLMSGGEGIKQASKISSNTFSYLKGDTEGDSERGKSTNTLDIWDSVITKKQQCDPNVWTVWVQPFGGAPEESVSIHHSTSRWANPACLNHFFHFEKSLESLLSLDNLKDCLVVPAKIVFENCKEGT